MVDVRGYVLRPPHCTTPAAVKANKNQKWVPLRAMKTFIRKKMGHKYITLLETVNMANAQNNVNMKKYNI